MKLLVSAETSREIDREAQSEWGFNTFALIESAGRSCARVFEEAFPRFFTNAPMVFVFAGPGNNGADALAMLRYWLLRGLVKPDASLVIAGKTPERGTPVGDLFASLKKMRVPVMVWDESSLLLEAEKGSLILDGITGTGVICPLAETPLAMAEAINVLAKGRNFSDRPLVVSVDVPSGLSDGWTAGMPAVNADVTLVIEPQKYCLYNPSARSKAGIILPVGEVFPRELSDVKGGLELLDWDYAKKNIPPVRPDVHKYGRGCVEIHAGSPGAVGAARIAARGAQAAGAGLVRLMVDEAIYLAAASGVSGIMVGTAAGPPGRFRPDAVLAGPGWGRAAREAPMKALAEMEQAGTPLILDADGIFLAKEFAFHGNALLTPHVGEFSMFTGIPVDEILDNPIPLLKKFAAEKNAFFLLKSHVMFIAAPDGRIGVLDGMSPNLAAGGSGDLLAGFCAALCARIARDPRRDLYAAAAAASCLFMTAAKSKDLANRFFDPLELADKAADIAGAAWLGRIE